MFPILFQHGRLTIYTYGLFVALGFLAALWTSTREAERRGYDPKAFQDLAFLVLITALLGARLFYVLIEWRYFVERPLEILYIWKGGLVFFGGFVCAALGVTVFVRVKGLPLFTTGDIVAPAVALGQSFGRLGCLFAGCCYGAACDLPWAITFTDPRGLAPLGVPLHPTQVYSAIGNFAIFVVLQWLARPRLRREGQLFGLYLVLYCATRFTVEMFRSDPRGALGPLSTSQALALPLFGVGLWLLFFRRAKTTQ